MSGNWTANEIVLLLKLVEDRKPISYISKVLSIRKQLKYLAHKALEDQFKPD
ncbi:hypothetical protein ACRQ5Q_13700 [Bradyrhizobium sp. PMVTL-01]|uniref:hypothetical protein n=1 Tax=Bradyrhizobium sp. PMVTL-01 TaxID=3434999 RepID=UPI003F717BA0